MNMMPIWNVKLNLWPLSYVQYNVYMITIVLMSIYILWYQKKAEFYPPHWDQLYRGFSFSCFWMVLVSAVLVSISLCSSTLYPKPEKCTWNTVVFIQMKTNTLMAHKSRRCLHIFLCVSILQISHLFCFTWYSFDCFSFYATIMCELPKNALYTVCRYAPLLFFCIFEFGQ